MKVLKCVAEIEWFSPEEQPPSKYGQYYVIKKDGEHEICIYHPNGAWGGYQWEGGAMGVMGNYYGPEDIEVWTELLSY